MTRLGAGTLYFDRGDGRWEPLGSANAVVLDGISVQFDTLRFVSKDAADTFLAFAALLRKQRHWRSPSRPFFPKRRRRSMKGK